MALRKLMSPLSLLIISMALVIGCIRQTPSPLAGQDGAVDSTDITSYLVRAKTLADERSFSAALEALATAASLAPQDVRPTVVRGQIYLQQHRWQSAANTFQQVLAYEPANLAAINGLARARLEQGQPVAALNLWRQALAIDGDQTESRLGLGETYLARGDYQQAETTFREVLTLTPSPEAHWALAALLLPTDLAAGRSHLERIAPPTSRSRHLQAALAPFEPGDEQAEIAAISGIALVQLGEWRLAHHALTVAVELNPADAKSWAFLGHTLVALNQPAMAAFNQARTLDPNLALVPYFEGLYLRKQGLPDLAVQRFLAALDLDPNNLGVALETAQTLAEAGDYLSAEAWYRAILKLEPDATVYQEALVSFYVDRGYRVAEVGLAEAERLAVLAPDDPRAHDLLGWARFQNGDLGGAEESLRRAIALDTNNVAARYHLGRLLETQHRNVEAQMEYTHVVDWDTSGIYRNRILETTR